MSNKSALEKLRSDIHSCLTHSDEYVCVHDFNTVCLDGYFTVADLEIIVTKMKLHAVTTETKQP